MKRFLISDSMMITTSVEPGREKVVHYGFL